MRTQRTLVLALFWGLVSCGSSATGSRQTPRTDEGAIDAAPSAVDATPTAEWDAPSSDGAAKDAPDDPVGSRDTVADAAPALADASADRALDRAAPDVAALADLALTVFDVAVSDGLVPRDTLADAAPDGPPLTGPPRKVIAIAAGFQHTCAVLDDGRLKCWGNNENGQLGLGDNRPRGDQPGQMGDNLPAVALGTGRRAKAIDANARNTCVILENDQAKCWGINYQGQLGQGDEVQRGYRPGQMGDALPPIDLGTGRTARQILVGYNIVCAVLDNARAKCWGAEDGIYSRGQLGQGDTLNRGAFPGQMGDNLPPIELGAGRTVLRLATRADYVCSILDNARVKCWGDNEQGELGLGDVANRGDMPGEMGDALPFVNLGSGRTVKAIAGGNRSNCAILDDGRLKCWGRNYTGQLGTGDAIARGGLPEHMGDNLPAVDLGAGNRAAAVALGSNHTCALLTDGRVKCWGANGSGELGLGDSMSRGFAPGQMGDNLPYVSLGTGQKATALAVGDTHSCALLADGSVKCWGRGVGGALGQGDSQDRGGMPGQMGDALPPVDLGH
jgi:alpha-tubulin suppressor-like RCC1 family protein